MTQFTANKKPLFDSDIDPKRIKSVADGLRRQGEFELARMLDGYADLLEAREKAVPVAWRSLSLPTTFICDAPKNLDCEKWQPLYTHPGPSDAERLAEALRNLVSEWVAIADDGDATLEDSTIGYRACADRLSAMLATHSTQAQPPAASVTDAIARRMVAEYDAVLCGDPTATRTDGMRAALEAALATQENPNG